MVLETLAFSLLNHLTRLVAREDFIVQCRLESYKSYRKLYSSMHIYENTTKASVKTDRGFLDCDIL
jgi:hypothetical protein